MSIFVIIAHTNGENKKEKRHLVVETKCLLKILLSIEETAVYLR